MRWMIVTGDFSRFGGMDVANWNLANHLSKSNEVHLVAHNVSSEFAIPSNIKIHIAPKPFNRNALGAPLLSRLGVKVRRQLNGVVRSVSNGGNCNLKDVNWVHFVHSANSLVSTNSFFGKIKDKISHLASVRHEREIIPSSRKVICNSELTARHVVELLNVDASRVEVVYLACDLDRFPITAPSERQLAKKDLGLSELLRVIFVGALGDHRKGFDLVYRLWCELCSDQDWDAILTVVGSGRTLKYWKMRAAQDNISERIEFLGYRKDVPQLLKASDLMLHPARYEPYGLGIHEGICTGLPVVVSSNTGISERFLEYPEFVLQDAENISEMKSRMLEWRRNHQVWMDRTHPLTEQFRARGWMESMTEFVNCSN